MFVRKSLQRAVFILMTAALLLTACNMGATPAPTVDVNAINTAAVATAMGQLSAQFTQTALAAPSATPISTNTALPLPTFALPTTSGALPTLSFNTTPTTPIAGFTALASPAAPAATTSLGDSCNNSTFEGDVTIPDGSILEPGEDFQKIWAIRNSGTCTWDEGYTFVFIAGDPRIDPYNFEFKNSSDFVSGGEAINIAINLTAPLEEGTYEGHWRMRSDSGYYFGTIASVYFEVRD
jgi:hypothetical protein